MHPTVKSVAFVADAIKDCLRRGEVVLDGLGGSGSTLIPAENTRRSAGLVELDPLYCDTISRFEACTGKPAQLLSEGAQYEHQSAFTRSFSMSSATSTIISS